MSKETHAIVWFKDEYTRDGQKVIDLIPCSWLLKSKNNMYCLYPPKILKRIVRAWSEKSKEPNLKWGKIEVEVLKYACKYYIFSMKFCVQNYYIIAPLQYIIFSKS